MINQSGPDFVCIGAQKSGTTWLYENLAKHPEVWVPPIKEFHYFNRVCINDVLLGNWNIPHPHGVARYASALKSMDVDRLRWLLRYYELGMEKDWYLGLFSERYSGGRVCGELTPDYSTLEERGVKYASEVLDGNVQIIFIVRNPVFRSWSAVKMLLRGRGVSADSVSTEYLIKMLKSPYITLCSEYSRIIPLWKKYFKNVRVLSFDMLSDSPRDFLSEISRIINVGNTWDDKVIEKHIWSDNKKIPIPSPVLRVLIEQYGNEVEKLKSIKECNNADAWQKEISALNDASLNDETP